ncbi:hypothetical protein C8R44DRAFT_737841 [Mycena epipterygia]|nr:hypothetical protein C8R44DRAFT_737841 [Mycena epipterygia]
MQGTILIDTIVDAARRARNTKPPLVDEIRCRLEWAWGLKYQSLDQHLCRFADPHLVDILGDDNSILIPHSDDLSKIFSESALSCTFSRPHTMIQELYEGRKSFEYLVLPVDPSSEVAPRVLISSIPPHLTIGLSVDKILKRCGYTQAKYKAFRDSLVQLVEASPPAGATFKPNNSTFIALRYVHESWASCYVPPRFLGLDDSDEDLESDDLGSSTMECPWEANYNEPCRRLLPHELEQEPVIHMRLPSANDEADDAISYDSYVSGVDDSAKECRAREDDGEDHAWLTGMRSWAQSASGIIDGQVLSNDGQIEEDLKEKPRVATSLDLEKPDYLSRHKIQGAT